MLKPFQRETVDFSIKNPYTIVGNGPGLGKTLSSIVTGIETRSKTLIVCPSYLKLKWKHEILKFYPDQCVSLLESDKSFYALWDTDFAIISYSFVAKAGILFEWADLVVFDEGHFLKGMESQRSDASHRLIFENSIKRCLILTGTPIKNRVWELYSLIAICNYNPQITNSEFLDRFPSYVDFANYFSYLNEREIEVVSKKTGKKKKISVQSWEGHRNIRELREVWMKDIFIRFTADEVLDLPPYTEIDVPVSYKDNKQLELEFNRFQSQGEYSGVGSDVKREAAIATAPFTAEYALGLLNTVDCVVVFSDHIDSCDLIAKKLGVPSLTGEMNADKRMIIAEEFQAGKYPAISATYGALSTGVDLFRSGDWIGNDPPWVSGDLLQSWDRIRRIGQDKPCRYHKIHGTIQSTKIYNKLKEKQKTIDAVWEKL